MRAVRLFYNLFFPIVLVILLPGFLLRMLRRGKYRHKFGQRFAIYSARVRQKLSPGGWTWVHAVSVGEVLIALKLIREMKQQDPDLRVVLSTTTSTGYVLANRQRCEWLEPIYHPIDFYWIARRAIRLIRPKQMILVEAEIWPNLTAEAKAQGAKLALVNARLSPRSEQRYRLIRWLAAPIFNQLDLLCVQDPIDQGRWRSLGVRPEKILLTGSIKFDEMAVTRPARDFRPVLRDLGVADDAPILLAASTHAGEEAILGQIFLKLREKFPGLFYVAIPRHAERGRDVRDQLERLGLNTALRVGETYPASHPEALVVNTTGELRDWYACATAVFVGKSLLSTGGQNPAEAVAAGKPVVVGPNMQNFSTLVAQLVRQEGICQVSDEAALEEVLYDFLRNPEKGRRLASNGAHCLEEHHGATARTVEALAKLTRS
jgi:3-deoxy-D-manno-octulosonic-acid transferase